MLIRSIARPVRPIMDLFSRKFEREQRGNLKDVATLSKLLQQPHTVEALSYLREWVPLISALRGVPGSKVLVGMRVYTVLMERTAVTAAQDLIRVSAPADAIIVLLRATLGQTASETSEQLGVSLNRSSTDGTGTAFTAEKHEDSDPAFGGTAIEDLSVDTTKTANPPDSDSFNVLNGWLHVPMPEERIVAPPSGRLVSRIEDAPGASLTMNALMRFGEMG